MRTHPMKLETNTSKSRCLLEWPVRARKSTKYITRAMMNDDDDEEYSEGIRETYLMGFEGNWRGYSSARQRERERK